MRNKFVLTGLAGALSAVLITGTAMGATLPNRDYHGTAVETVSVHPYGIVHVGQLLGHIDGYINPQKLSMSKPVHFGDLNLKHSSDWAVLRQRVKHTAVRECKGIDEVINSEEISTGMQRASQHCVRTAVTSAMARIGDKLSAGQLQEHALSAAILQLCHLPTLRDQQRMFGLT